MSLIARHLESLGIPTMCMGSALDILQAARPPRATFVDFPLGHTVGKPFDPAGQYNIVREGLRGFALMETAGTIRHLDVAWSDDQDWRAAAMNPAGDDTRSPRDTTPRYQFEADRILAEAGN